MTGFDDWAPDQEVRYELIAKVNDVVAFKATDYDPEIITKSIALAEEQVAQLLEDQWRDAEPDADAIVEDMKNDQL